MTAEVHITLFTHAHTHMLVRTKTRLSMHAPNSFVQFKRMHAAANTYTDALTHAHTHTHAACMLQIPIFSLCKCPQMHTHMHSGTHTRTHPYTRMLLHAPERCRKCMPRIHFFASSKCLRRYTNTHTHKHIHTRIHACRLSHTNCTRQRLSARPKSTL